MHVSCRGRLWLRGIPAKRANMSAGPATDPVCGMTVDAETAGHRHTHGGTTYVFCGARCAEGQTDQAREEGMI